MTDDLIARARAHADLHPESAALIGELLELVPEPGRLVSRWNRRTDDGRWVGTVVAHESAEAMAAWHEEFGSLSMAIPNPTDEQMEWLLACRDAGSTDH